MEFLGFLVYIICLSVSFEAAFRKYPEGEKSVEAIKRGAVHFLEWRANAELKEDLKGLFELLEKTLIILVLTYALINSYSPKLLGSNAIYIFMIFVFFWHSLKWSLHLKEQFYEWLGFGLLFSLVPWLIAYAPPFQSARLQIGRIFHPIVSLFSLQDSNLFWISLLFSVCIFLATMLIFLAYAGMSYVGTYFIYFSLKLVSMISRYSLKLTPKLLYYAALLYVFIYTVYLSVLTKFP